MKMFSVEAKSGDEKKKQRLEAGFLLGALKIAATLLKPTITSYLKSRIELYQRKYRHAKA